MKEIVIPVLGITERKFTIGLDFDGTVVEHRYPKIGKSIGAEPYLIDFIELGGLIVLNTMRSGEELKYATYWFKQRNISLFGINNNPLQKTWTTSPKIWADMYIDDAAYKCPLTQYGYVDWSIVGPDLINTIKLYNNR